ncbi:outer membrane beta-barrel protein [Tenacibaculum jejuense]|uniref:Uncharacterized protein n=1 Tax=Tenacibaculum jejuense TaxID=584609 RepID=A0A238U979_9FLAO|nr:outer membrane beta-barrel protein [Tenacibaculum jejuense]SNR15741.1 Protein of unknown function precursor [Tenacibaculum jejuense]
MIKNSFLMLCVVLCSFTASAQFYVSFSGGYAFGAGEKEFRSNSVLTPTGIVNLGTFEGSYGEGVQTQLRGGYFFNEKWGVEVGVGYIYGTDQQFQKVEGILDLKTRGRAFGASLSGIYNINENFYVRAGMITKIAGKTEAVVDLTLPNALTGIGDVKADFTTDFRGKFPLGFIGAAGYKFPISDNLSLFAEVEYMSIDVTRDISELGDFEAVRITATGPETVSAAALAQQLGATPLAELSSLLSERLQWGENGLPSPEAPYSSFGINFGVTYSFK